MKRRTYLKIIAIVIPLVMITAFQNCAEDALGVAGSAQIECFPEDQPCLQYSLTISSYMSHLNAVSIDLSGSLNDDYTPAAHTEFSRTCEKQPGFGHTALCMLDRTASATIRSIDRSRSLTVTFTPSKETERFEQRTDQ